MASNSFISLLNQINGLENTKAVAEAQAMFTAKLHGVVREGGLSLERELHDWFGEARFNELLDGAAPSLEEATTLTQLISQHEVILANEQRADFEPITAPSDSSAYKFNRTKRFSTSQIMACVAGIVAVGSLGVTGAVYTDREAGRMEITRLEVELHAQRVETAARLVAGGRAELREGQHGAALELFERARQHTAAWSEANSDSADAVYFAAQSEYWIAETYRRDGIEPDAVRSGLEAYARLAQRLEELEPTSPRTAAEAAYAALNLAGLEYRDRNFTTALTGFLQALDATRHAHALDASVMHSSDIANAYAWVADAQFAVGDIRAAVEARRAQLDVLQTANLNTRLTLTAQRWLIDLLVLTGETQEAATLSDAALASVEALLAEAPDNLQLHRRQIALMSQRARIALARGDLFRAKLISDRAMALDIAAREGTDRIPGPEDAANISLVAAEVALGFELFEIADARARQTLRFLDEIEGERALVPALAARAYNILGQALAAQGFEGEAERESRRGLNAIDLQNGHSLERFIGAQLLARIGREREALVMREQLSSIGFSEPSDQSFWAELRGRASTQLNGDNQ